MRAKKSYGQHFLTSEVTAEKIGNFLLRKEGIRNVLEIGPGQGMLTKYLKDQDINLKAIEADRDMVSYLSRYYPNLDIIFLDFLKLNLNVAFDGEPFYITGNFPYNISSQIVFKMLNNHEMVPEMVGMFQKEVAERIIAPPGSKTYGVISVLTQAFYKGEMLLQLPPGAFNPPPKVNSSVIRLSSDGVEELKCDARLFRQIVKTSFNSRRKMLRNTLKVFIDDPDILNEPIFTERPEQLSVRDFEALTNRIEKLNKNES